MIAEPVMDFSRVWAMPNAETFKVEPILGFVQKYLLQSTVSIDPFARNNRLATWTNDLNPATAADYHMEAEEFLRMLPSLGVKADLFIFDPPYSSRQVKECYDSIGKTMQMEDGQTSRLHKLWKTAALPLLDQTAVVLSFGWNTVGFGSGLGFEIEEILLVCHGGGHNDTICMAERRRLDYQEQLSFGVAAP
jgi:hypothetical protein